MKKAFQWIRIFELIVGLLLVMIVSVTLGSADLSIVDSLRLVVSKIPVINQLIDITDISTTYEVIVWKVRLPRIVLSALAGGALAVVGAVFQGVFGNSLADPHILGVSSGAALGATFAMLTGISVSFFGLGTIGVFAFIGALVTVFFVYRISRIGGDISITNMLLTGTAISTMLSALISLLMTFHHSKIEKVYMWTLGSFSAATWEKVGFLALFVLVCVTVLLLFAGKLNIMMLGEEDAKCLGIDTDQIRWILIVMSSLLVAATVSVSGIIGFVGLIVPHCVRMLCGADNRRVMPYSLLTGAILMVICDTLARTIAAPTEIPVGVITSIFGAPYFIALVITRKKKLS